MKIKTKLEKLQERKRAKKLNDNRKYFGFKTDPEMIKEFKIVAKKYELSYQKLLFLLMESSEMFNFSQELKNEFSI